MTQTLRNSLKKARVTHAYLFSGPRGTGKTSTARILAKALLCESPTEAMEACGSCSSCVDVMQGGHIDLIEIDAASHRGIDEMRALREGVQFTPHRGKKKVYIIDEVHMLSKDASNALLKTLEEPPAYVHFMLATTELHKILDTIVSRCQVFHLQPVSAEIIAAHVQEVAKKEGLDVDAHRGKEVAGLAHGGMRDALSLLEQVLAGTEGQGDPASLDTFVACFLDAYEQHESLERLYAVLDQVKAHGLGHDRFLTELLSQAFIRLRASLASGAGNSRLTGLLRLIQESLPEAKYATMPLLPFEVRLATAELSDAPTTHVSTPTSKQTVDQSPRKPTVLDSAPTTAEVRKPAALLSTKAQAQASDVDVKPAAATSETLDKAPLKPAPTPKPSVKSEEPAPERPAPPESVSPSVEDIASLFGGSVEP